MNTLVFAVVLFAATSVFGQDPYEYVDDALLQRVGQIIFEYDQKIAASRSAGGSNVDASRNEVSGGYQYGGQERVARMSNFQNDNYAPKQQVRSQRQYNPVQQQQQSYVQQQPQHRNQYQGNHNQYQRQVPAQARTYQAPAQVPQQNYYQAPRPVARQAPAPVHYQEPQVVQQQQSGKSTGFSAYTLSQPEVVQRVAEFHFTDGQETNFEDSYRKSYGGKSNGGFRLA